MHKLARYSILPLLLLHATISANLWSVMGLELGRPLYWMAILMAFVPLFYSCYRKLALILITGGLFCQFLEIYPALENFESNIKFFRILFTAILFILSSAVLYGENPRTLSRQLNLFLILCLPIMVLQLTGASYWLLGWNTTISSHPSISTPDAIGKFKEIALYPTLFVPYSDLQYHIGQARPVGLLYANNILSVVIVCSLVLNLYWHRRANLTLSDIAVNMVAVLSLSKLVILFAFILYLFTSLSKVPKFRILARKSLFIFIICLLAYALFFPGLFVFHFNLKIYTVSFLYRFLDIANSLNLGFLNPLTENLTGLHNVRVKEGTDYSGIAVLLKSGFLWPLAGLFLLSYLSIRKNMHMFVYFNQQNQDFYNLLYIGAFVSLIAMPFLHAPLIQFIFGIGLFPFLRKYWRGRIGQSYLLSKANSSSEANASPAT